MRVIHKNKIYLKTILSIFLTLFNIRMPGLKRKAENQLTKTVSSQHFLMHLQDCTQSQSPMAVVYGIGTTLWSWCKSVLLQGTLVPSSSPVRTVKSSMRLTNSVFYTGLILTETLENDRFSHDISHEIHNLQKICDDIPTLSRSNSISVLHSAENHEVLDVSECDIDQARQKLDQFWEPKPMPWTTKSVSVGKWPSSLESQKDPESGLEDQSSSDRISDPSKVIGNVDFDLQLLKLDREPKIGSLIYDRQYYNDRIKASLESILVESPKQLKISEFKRAKNIARAKEKAEKDRQNAIKESRQRRLCRSFPKKKLVHYLDSCWEDKVERAHTFWGEDVLTTSIGGTELRIKDFKTLLDCKAWLNDEIINAYIEWIVDAANKAVHAEYLKFGIKPTSSPKFIAHNSFFFETLRKRGPASLDRLMKRKGAPGLALLDVDTVFVPICSGSHWTLGVVRPIAKTIEYFDSMGGSPSTFIHNIQEWLKHQLGAAYSPKEWSTPKTNCVNQTNGYDCGVFVCTNAFCVAVGLETSCYQESDMTQQRKNIAAILLNRGFNGEFAWRPQETGLFY
ncbi:putative ulp1 protease family protein [Golovinomyces cichoracearum]|uniref:Putative ulp1 protease family protein n=1 Tax=Golovinomyces cichoracearum TaxID=62708 RepID=A0A420HJI8_9PEZI|nr:putative ulp1 protease family protein [Golovinomyces cichoracearum]